MSYLGPRAGEVDDGSSKIKHGKFLRIAEIYRAGHLVIASHQTAEAIYQIIDIAERSGLLAIAVDRDIATEQRLNNEV